MLEVLDDNTHDGLGDTGHRQLLVVRCVFEHSLEKTALDG
jgi:hypothetical protein